MDRSTGKRHERPGTPFRSVFIQFIRGQTLTGRVGGTLSARGKAVLAMIAVFALAAPFLIGVIHAPLIRAQSAPQTVKGLIEAAYVTYANGADLGYL